MEAEAQHDDPVRRLSTVNSSTRNSHDAAGLECRVVIRGGSVLTLRAIRPDDAARLVDFHEHLSPRSIYRRFFFVHPNLSAAEVERFTEVDYLDRFALVAEEGGHLRAVGRYERMAGTTEAEIAFVVTDEYQHHGIGTVLLELLADAAWGSGVTTFVAYTLTENRDMLDVFMKSGFKVSTSSEDGTTTVRFPIDPDGASPARRASRTFVDLSSIAPGNEDGERSSVSTGA
jgi:GNAT superfamily N-acetyltransferase